MDNKNLKLLFFSSDDSQIKSLHFGFKKLALILVFLVISVFVMTFLFSSLFITFYHNYKIASLKRQKAILTSQLSSMEQQVHAIKKSMEELENIDNNLRILADLPKVDSDVREMGVGGTVENADFKLEGLPLSLKNRTKNLNIDLEKFERKVDFQRSSFHEIEERLESNKAKIKHTPSIRPMKVGWLKSEFGYRMDPFLDVVKHHPGIDIAAEKGTPIYAPADGVVEKVKKTWHSRRGYGRYVIIDHGFNIETLYAHLSDINVKLGQKIKRREKIGEVGSTGKSTGYHLHYEVQINGKAVNPMSYILDWYN